MPPARVYLRTSLIVLGFVLAPGATIGFLFRKYVQYKNAMKQTVAAIKEARAVDSQTLHDALKFKQSADTEKIVGKIKADLQRIFHYFLS